MSTTTIRCFVTLTNGSDIVALTAGNAGNNGISLAAPNVIEDMQLVANNPINATRFIKGSLSTTTLQLQEAWSGATLTNVEVRISTSGAAVANLTQAVRDLINTKAAEGTALTTAVTQAQASADAAAASAGSIGTQLDNLDIKVQQATDAATAAGGSAGTAVTKAGEAGASAEAAATHVAAIGAYAQTALDEAAISLTAAAEAKAARDLAVAAWAASTAPAETLAAMSQLLHFGTIVDFCIDEPWRHSDGGAWTDRCQDKSWYTEALGGDRWIGQRATIAAAWTAAGSAVGAVFQATTTAGPCTAGKFYAATSATTVTEVFRGINCAYPKSGIFWIIEAAREVGYEVATGAMFKVIPRTGKTLTSVCATGGKVLVGSSAGVFVEDFVGRSVGAVERYTTSSAPAIVNATVNDITITVLTGAPLDPATDLPVPTIAVGTAGGVSIIKNDGAVVNSQYTGAVISLTFTRDGNLVYNDYTSGGYRFASKSAMLSAAFGQYFVTTQTGGSIPASLQNTTSVSKVSGTNNVVLGHTTGVSILKENTASPAKGMVAYITNAYNTGWLPGDIRLCALADTVAETVAASGELVTGNDATFSASVGAWASSPAFISSALAIGGELQVTVTEAYGRQVLAVPSIAGRTYVLTGKVRKISGAGEAMLGLSTSLNGSSANYMAGVVSSAFANVSASILAIGAFIYVACGVNNTSTTGAVIAADDISVKLATPDRSVKNNGLILYGTLTKTAVASGAALVAYSGFSVSNYFEQPYNASLDFGTGDFCVMGWIKGTDNYCALLDRGDGAIGFGSSISIGGNATNKLYAKVGGVAGYSTADVFTGTLAFVVILRILGVVYIYINGTADSSFAAPGNINVANAVTRLGVRVDGNASFDLGSLALWRVSATATSADQIAQIYRDELALFQPGAQCTIAGSSTAVTALAYDDTSDLLHVGTSWGRSSFKALLRVESAATTVGSITSLAASGGIVLTGGTNATIYQPALKLRDELRRREIAAKALGQTPVFFEFDTASFNSPTTSGSAALTASSIVGTPYLGMGITGTGIPAGTTLVAISGTAYTMSAAATVTNAGAVAIGQSSFTLQQGYTARAVYSAESLKREGTTKTYTRAHDGYRETINFSVSPGSATWVSIMAVRA